MKNSILFFVYSLFLVYFLTSFVREAHSAESSCAKASNLINLVVKNHYPKIEFDQATESKMHQLFTEVLKIKHSGILLESEVKKIESLSKPYKTGHCDYQIKQTQIVVQAIRRLDAMLLSQKELARQIQIHKRSSKKYPLPFFPKKVEPEMGVYILDTLKDQVKSGIDAGEVAQEYITHIKELSMSSKTLIEETLLAAFVSSLNDGSRYYTQEEIATLASLDDSQPENEIKLVDHVMVAKIRNFKKGTADEIKKSLIEYQKNGPLEGLVLDLTESQGSFLMDWDFPEALSIAGIFEKSKNFAYLKDQRESPIPVSIGREAEPLYHGMVVIRMSSKTAKAAELLAASLNDYDRALVIGNTEHTLGESKLYNIFAKENNTPIQGYLLLSVGEVLSASTKPIHGVGVGSDLLEKNYSQSQWKTYLIKRLEEKLGSLEMTWDNITLDEEAVHIAKSLFILLK